ncbi:MAG: hypoxanthine phosphoribosyltransferase [Planctomycetaceae bacterium]
MKRLLEAEQIRNRVAELGKQIQNDYRECSLTILGILTGSIVLISDLIRQINLPLRIGLIQASSYRGRTTIPGELTVNAELVPDIRNRDVLLVDDIFDTGQTLSRLVEMVADMQPASLRSAVLLRKTGRATVELQPDYFGFEIPDEFVVGYGLDYNDEYRHLPYIAVLETEDL